MRQFRDAKWGTWNAIKSGSVRAMMSPIASGQKKTMMVGVDVPCLMAIICNPSDWSNSNPICALKRKALLNLWLRASGHPMVNQLHDTSRANIGTYEYLWSLSTFEGHMADAICASRKSLSAWMSTKCEAIPPSNDWSAKNRLNFNSTLSPWTVSMCLYPLVTPWAGPESM